MLKVDFQVPEGIFGQKVFWEALILILAGTS